MIVVSGWAIASAANATRHLARLRNRPMVFVFGSSNVLELSLKYGKIFGSITERSPLRSDMRRQNAKAAEVNI